MEVESERAGHERSDMSARGVTWFAIALALGTAVIAFLVWWMHAALDHSSMAWPKGGAVTAPQFRAPAPELQTAPAEELRGMRAAEDKALREHAWVDRKTGIIRIPQDRAMELILQRGLPATGTTMPLPGPPPTPQPAPGLPEKAGAP